ncbi:hypothetical protein M1563_00455 [Patescibacteria group bacterium]|nr:hypothetical protein [Patescibacteria group bacterium]
MNERLYEVRSEQPQTASIPLIVKVISMVKIIRNNFLGDPVTHEPNFFEGVLQAHMLSVETGASDSPRAINSQQST